MNNDEIELLTDQYGDKFHILKNSSLDLLDKNIVNNGAIKSLDNKYYYESKLLHNENGPAVEFTNGTKIYIAYGKIHRDDGPAIELNSKVKEYWINGNKISEEKFYLEKELRKNIINSKLDKKIKI